MWPIFSASSPLTSVIPGGRRRRRLASLEEDQFDPNALDKLERAGARWLQRPDGTWARWSYLGAEWIDSPDPPEALTSVAKGPPTGEVIWTDASGAWAITTEPPSTFEETLPPPILDEQVLPPPEVTPSTEVPAQAQPSGRGGMIEEYLLSVLVATIGLIVAYAARAAVAVSAEPIPVTIFVPWLWDNPDATPSVGETIRGILLLAVFLSAGWVGLRRLFLAYRMPPIAAALVSLGIVGGVWLTGFMLGRPV